MHHVVGQQFRPSKQQLNNQLTLRLKSFTKLDMAIKKHIKQQKNENEIKKLKILNIFFKKNFLVSEKKFLGGVFLSRFYFSFSYILGLKKASTYPSRLVCTIESKCLAPFPCVDAPTRRVHDFCFRQYNNISRENKENQGKKF